MTQTVKVFITVDAEIWPHSPGWPHVPLPVDNYCPREVSWYFYGGEGPAARGLPYQLKTLADSGLKATFFVDPLFSFALGKQPLVDVVNLIQAHGQEIGLHLHPEWLTDRRCRNLPRFCGPMLASYDEPDQISLIRVAVDRLEESGGCQITSFRAGSWGANRSTIRALRANGIAYDSSLNPCFPVSFPELDQRHRYTQPINMEGVWILPVSHFMDSGPSGRRPLHVCACSFGELRAALEHASANDWFAVVIVLHSFEFVRVDQIASANPAKAQRLLVKRFEIFCEYLAQNTDRFSTCHFADLEAPQIVNDVQRPALRSTRLRTAARYVEQLVSRFY